jgi:hypothetical protein
MFACPDHMSTCPYDHMSTCPYVHMSMWTCGHMDIWTCGHMDMWTYGHLDIWIQGHVAVMQDMTIYTTVYGLYDYKCIHNNVLKTLTGMLKIYTGKKLGEFAGLLRRFSTLYVVSHYMFCPYTLCLIRPLSIDVLSH